jgi:release factor glutamine methyltransferase
LKELLRAAFSQFEKNQIQAVDAELLLAHLLGISRKQIHAQNFDLADKDKEKIASEYADLINQRLLGRPVQYITGSAPFRYLDLEVGEGVLIPRPESELIVDRVIGYLNSVGDKD